MTVLPAAVELRPAAAQITEARARIAPHVHRTPLEHAPRLSALAGVPVHLKLECWQPTRSFKVRGAFNALAQLESGARERGVVAASAGNHGQAVALAARVFGMPARILVPGNAPETKKMRIRGLGAHLDDGAATYDEAEILAAAFSEESGATLVHAFSDDAVVAGAGTVALEILEDLPDVREILVPVGGGGLVAGIGIVCRQRHDDVRVIGVQSTETRVMHASLVAGRVVELPVTPTVADGLAGCIDHASFERVRHVVDEIVLVEEDALPAAIRGLYVNEGVVTEGAGAVGAAALESLDLSLRGPAVVVITGGNIDAQRLAEMLRPGEWRR